MLHVTLATLVAAGLLSEDAARAVHSRLAGKNMSLMGFDAVLADIRAAFEPVVALTEIRKVQQRGLFDAIAALEKKVGIDASQDERSLDWRVARLERTLGAGL